MFNVHYVETPNVECPWAKFFTFGLISKGILSDWHDTGIRLSQTVKNGFPPVRFLAMRYDYSSSFQSLKV